MIELKNLPERLNEAQEQLLARTIVKNSSVTARNMLVMHAMREAFFYARRCCRKQLQEDEVFSLVYDALCRAAKNFKPGKLRFFAYAKVYVRGAICREWKSKDVVKNSSSHETLIVEDFDPVDGEEIQPKRGIATLNFTEPEFDDIHFRELWARVRPLLKRLSPRERKVVRMRYNLGLNYREIGDRLGVSRSATQMTHTKAMRKLRCALSGNSELFR